MLSHLDTTVLPPPERPRHVDEVEAAHVPWQARCRIQLLAHTLADLVAQLGLKVRGVSRACVVCCWRLCAHTVRVLACPVVKRAPAMHSLVFRTLSPGGTC